MNEIDWSKAPEGATHYDTPFGLFCNANGYWDDYGWVEDDDQNEWGTYRYIERPHWTGEGLPPVGAVVEWFSPVYGWLGGRVVGHDGIVSVISHNDGYTGCHLHALRTIRTHEQLAAEQREKAVGEMLVDALGPGAGSNYLETYMMQRLYDAGYRKVEGGAQ